jgi:intergrase/recombinase
LNPGSLAWKSSEIDWQAFLVWLQKKRRIEHCRVVLNQAKKYHQCLLSRNFSEISNLKDTVRPNAMKALSCLAKFLGIHEEFKTLVKNYDLKWVGKSAEDLIIDRITKNESSDEIFEWIKQVKQVRPELTEFIEFMSITGLRLVESVASYNLIIKLSKDGKLNSYYNAQKSILEHFKYKQIFFRKSKKAYISFVSADLINRIRVKRPLASVCAVQNLIKKKGLKLRFADIRETHGTLMTKTLKDNEIDFIQGRATGSVFMRNYFNPSLINDLSTRVFEVTREIEIKIKAQN